MISKLFKYITTHKLLLLVVLALLGIGGYYGYQKWFVSTTTTRYLTAKAQRGVLVSSITGTGQVAVSDQVDISAKASGDVIFVGATAGQEVKAGTLLLSLNARDALKTVRDAEVNLASTQLALDKLLKPVDPLSILQSENTLAQANETKQQAEDSLDKAYEDGFNSVSNAFLDLPAIMYGLKDILNGNSFATNVSNIDWYTSYGIGANQDNFDKVTSYRNSAEDTYITARDAFNANFDHYKNVARTSDTSTIEAIILETYNTSKLVANAVKSSSNFLDLLKDIVQNTYSNPNIPATMVAHQSTLQSYIGTTNSQLSNLLSIKSTIENSKNSIVSADRTISEKIISLADLKAGVDPLDVQSQKLSLKQKQNSLLDAREKLADYSVRAPFDGVLASFTVEKGDTISSGASLGTLITKQRIATISLNEIDVAKVKVGQKVMLTFDAIDGLNISGSVAEVDALGTVSQGVVSYNVKIAFDLQDDRIKPGMSVSASVILSSKPDVLMVPSSAVKNSTVDILVNGAPVTKTVVAGDNNDTMTEIVSGINEGDDVVTQKIVTNSATAKAASTASVAPGAGGGGGQFGGGAQNAFRALR